MEIISGTTDFFIPESTAVAIGKFDGVHRGHRKLLEQILDAGKDGYAAAVFTFDPPPGAFFSGRQGKELTTREEKRELFREAGIRYLVEFPLNRTTASMPPEEFVLQVLVEKMRAGLVAAGTDLSFGDRGAGDARLLEAMAGIGHYQVSIIRKVCMEGREISSSYVREEVEKGNMELAARLLGSPYSVTGTVEHGKKFGRRIGMPTANLLPPPDKLLPPAGVYFSRVLYAGCWHRGITNLGVKPTVSLENRMVAETYLYDFEGDLYGQTVTVQLLHFLRPERRFPDVEALKAQMRSDIAEGRNWQYLL